MNKFIEKLFDKDKESNKIGQREVTEKLFITKVLVPKVEPKTQQIF